MMMVFYPTMMCFTVVQFGLQIFYIIHEIKNKALADNHRILFAIGTFFLPHITMPIYYIAYLWKDASSEAKPAAVEPAVENVQPTDQDRSHDNSRANTPHPG